MGQVVIQKIAAAGAQTGRKMLQYSKPYHPAARRSIDRLTNAS